MTGFAIYDFPFGLLRIGYVDDTVTFLKKVDEAESRGQRTAFSDQVFSQVMEYLEGKRKAFDFAYRLEGTEFEKKVWDALCRIPYGETRTYKEIAIEIGNPRASRAVGMANNRNPVTLAVPCHRVVGSDGRLVGYAGGLAMKQALLEMERQNSTG
ncbi:MAG: methylated-DNA--[protein]-cysteine S-methyltransferase [Bilifractor sp.]